MENLIPRSSCQGSTILDFLDHHPIIVSLTDKDNMRMHIYFNFECAWVLEDTYEDMIKGNWKKGIDLDIKFEIWLFLLTSSSHFGFVLGLFRG